MLGILTVATSSVIGGFDETPSKAALFRAELHAPRLSFAMEAHDGLSAKIVEEAGFGCIWASGLAISAALGVRDNNEASWTQVLEVLEFMADATTIPILIDGDTGYGNFNNVRRLVRKLCQRGIAAVCIEDKLFPKTNSFVGDGQALADIEEFCGKIKAGKDCQTDPDFCIVARTEALVAGRGLDEALRRAEAYEAAGADAVLIHSKAKTADEVLQFAARWPNRCPLIIVPTTYSSTPTDHFRRAGIAMAIWANHNLRAAFAAMRTVSRRIREQESLLGVEDMVASLDDVFAITDNSELRAAERRYLASAAQTTRAVILAASRGEQLGALTADRPKCMVDVRGEPLLRRLVSTMRECGVGAVTVVRGYCKDAVDLPTVDCVDNDAYADTGEVASLACAAGALSGTSIISYGDILVRRYILENLTAAPGDIVLAVDAHWREHAAIAPERPRDLVICSRPFTGDYFDDEGVVLTAMGGAPAHHDASGEWIGMAKVSESGAQLIRREIDAMAGDGTARSADLPEMFARLVGAGVRIDVLYISGHWLDVNDAFDLATARNFL